MEVELTGAAADLRASRALPAATARSAGAEDRPRLAFDTDLDVGRERAAAGSDQGERPRQDESASKHESSFREGFGLRRSGRSSDSGLPPAPPSRPGGQWRVGAEASPLTAAGPSRTCTGFPFRSPVLVRRAYHGLPGEPGTVSEAVGPGDRWAALIFALSSIPRSDSGLGTWDEVLRKCAHVTEYAVLGFLLVRAIGREAPALLVGIALRGERRAAPALRRGTPWLAGGRARSTPSACSSAPSWCRRVLLQSRRA